MMITSELKRYAVFLFLFFVTFSLEASEKLSLAIIWHQHQPDYHDSETGQYALPWVRLHAVKDYYDMAKIIEKYPSLRLNFNLVPVLLQQIESYVYSGETDYLLSLHRKKIEKLSASEKSYLVHRCFDISHERVISCFPEYEALYLKRQKTLSRQELLDLQVWFNLVWFDPYFRESNPLLISLLEKKSGFTFVELQQLLDLQLKVMAEIIPLHRRLSERGQIELTCTPFNHPILPILCDVNSAAVSMPDAVLPDVIYMTAEAENQVRTAISFHETRFGTKPSGMWPAEGAVSDKALSVLAKNGIRWAATDERILAKTLKKTVGRTDDRLDLPEIFCCPYRVKLDDDKEITMLFRDLRLSDKIGFEYSGIPAEQAVSDFMQYMEDIRKKTAGLQTNFLVTVVLDGENAWENYPDDAHQFLELFYETIEKTPWLKTVRVSDFIRDNYNFLPVVEGIWPGSWINADYSTWIGENSENQAWIMLSECCRAWYQNRSSDKAENACRHLMSACGSDWYWWYGKDQESGNDSEFDRLFRQHIANCYASLGISVPQNVGYSLSNEGNEERTVPQLSVLIDGKREKEWDHAGYLEITTAGGVMQNKKNLIRLRYCSDGTNLFLGFEKDNFPGRLVLSGFSGSSNLKGYDSIESMALPVFSNTVLSCSKDGKVRFCAESGEAAENVKFTAECSDYIEIALSLELFPENNWTFVTTFIDSGKSMSTTDKITLNWSSEMKKAAVVSDPERDDYGAGSLVYPSNEIFCNGTFDLKGLCISEVRDKYRFSVLFPEIRNPWNSPYGFSLQTIDIYLCEKGTDSELLPGRKASLSGYRWKYCITLEGWKAFLYHNLNGKPEEILMLSPFVSSSGKEICADIPVRITGDIEQYAICAAVMAQDGLADEKNLRVRKHKHDKDEWNFGGAAEADSGIIDLLDPDSDQKIQLKPVEGKVKIRAIPLKLLINRGE